MQETYGKIKSSTSIHRQLTDTSNSSRNRQGVLALAILLLSSIVIGCERQIPTTTLLPYGNYEIRGFDYAEDSASYAILLGNEHPELGKLMIGRAGAIPKKVELSPEIENQTTDCVAHTGATNFWALCVGTKLYFFSPETRSIAKNLVIQIPIAIGLNDPALKALDFRPDSQVAAAELSDDNGPAGVIHFNPATGQVFSFIPEAAFRHSDRPLSMDEGSILMTKDAIVKFEPMSGNIISELAHHGGIIADLDFSSTGVGIFTSLGAPSSIPTIWNTTKKQVRPVRMLMEFKNPLGTAISPNASNAFATNSEGYLSIIDPESAEEIGRHRLLHSAINRVESSLDGKRLMLSNRNGPVIEVFVSDIPL